MIYQTFAQIYDELMDKELYSQWINFTAENVSHASSILELGCGAGHVALALDECGYDVTALDISQEMLTLAKDHQISANAHFMLVQADMTDLEDFPVYDAIICYCDSLCYLKNEQEFSQTFEEVFCHLDDDGIFLFDVHTPYKMQLFDGYSYHAEQAETILLWDSERGELPNSVIHHLAIFKSTDGRIYERFGEVHEQLTFELDVYLKLLKRVGFSKIEVLADFGKQVSPHSERWFFKVKK